MVSDLPPEAFDRAASVCTPRQLEVLSLARLGASQRQVALLLGLSRSTVRDHLDSALRLVAAADDSRRRDAGATLASESGSDAS